MTNSRRFPVQLTGRALAVVAVAMALLAMSAQPVAATHGQLAVGSEHSDDQEFSSGIHTNTTVEGAGSDAFVRLAESQVVSDDFEDGDISEYGVDTGSFSTVSTTNLEGQQALENNADGANIISTNGLAAYPKRGDEFNYLTRLTTDEHSYFYFAAQSETSQPDGYRIDIRANNQDELILYRFEDGSATSVGSTAFDPAVNTTYNVSVDWGSPTITIRVSSGGTTHATLSVDDSKYDSGGIGFQSGAPGIQWDYVKAPEPVDSGTYESTDHSVSNTEQAWTNLELTNATASVEWQAWDSSVTEWQVVNSSTFSSSGNYSLDISGTSFDTWRVNVSFEKTGETPTAQLHDEGILVETDPPTVDDTSLSPNSTETSTDESVTLSADISDSDFGTSHGDSVTIEWYVDGEQRGTTSATSSGTVSFTPSSIEAGEHEWHVEIEDEYGHRTTSATAQFTSPSEIRILDEQNPDQLVQDNVTVTVRLYAEDRTVERQVSDGILDMSGLPVDSTIVATTQADGWIDRRILIRDLTQQQQIYLLDSSAESVAITFDLQDKTGDFPDDSSQLYVQKAINTSSTENLEWKTVTGDYFGADGTFPTDLAYSQRYRLVIRNGPHVRTLGSYIPTESGTYPVTIGNIVWDVPEGESVYANSELRDIEENTETTYENATKEVYVEYFDSTGNTTELNINISVRGTNEVIYDATVYDVSSYTESIPLTENQSEQSLVVNVTADRGSDDFEHRYQHGKPDGPDLPGDPNIISLAIQVTLLAVIGLVAGSMPKKGGLVIVPVAFGVTWLGLWEIHPAALGIAGVIALFAAARSQGGGY